MSMQSITTSALLCQQPETLCTPEYLLVLSLSSGVEFCGAETFALETGTLFFLSPFADGQIRLKGGSRVLYAVLFRTFVEAYVGIPKRSSVVLPADGANTAKEKLIELFDMQYNDHGADPLDFMRAALDLLGALRPVISNLPPEDDNGSTTTKRNGEIVAFMEAHFREPICLGDLAEMLSLSKQYLSQMFHREFGATFTEYLQNLRLKEAERQLLTTEEPITFICENSGFPNLKAFNHYFRQKHGMTPKAFRKSHESGMANSPAALTERTLEDINQLLSSYRLNFPSSEEAISLTDIIDVNTGTPLIPKWNDMLNTDNALECLFAPAQNNLRLIQNTLHFRYIRITNFYSDELTPYIPSLGCHRFTYLLQLIEFFKSLDLIPMLVFGDTFRVMSDAVMVSDGSYSIAQKDWLELLDSMLTACISHWGAAWVSQWRFEFHMPAQVYGTDDPDVFLDLFEASSKVIREKLPEAEIGGPSLFLGDECMERWNAWLQGIRARKLSVDFISGELWADQMVETRYFAGAFGEQQARQTLTGISNADVAAALQKVRFLRQKMTEYGVGNKKLYLTAVGITKYQAVSAQLAGHCAAHLVKLNLELAALADGIGCWKALNNETEYPDAGRIIGNGCGLIGRYGLKNINFYAYQFQAQLFSIRLFQGLHCLVTTDGHSRYSILIHNCKPYSDYFCKNYLKQEGIQYWNKRLYTGNSVLRQNLRFNGILSGGYLVKQYIIGDRHGCITAVIQDMGEFQQNKEDEVSYIAGQSMPYQHTFRVEAKDGLELSVKLQPNDVMLLQIEPEIKI